MDAPSIKLLQDTCPIETVVFMVISFTMVLMDVSLMLLLVYQKNPSLCTDYHYYGSSCPDTVTSGGVLTPGGSGSSGPHWGGLFIFAFESLPNGFSSYGSQLWLS